MPTKPVRVRVVTWNAGDQPPPADVTSLLGLDVPDQRLADVVALGLQELVDDQAWFTLILAHFRSRGYVRVKTRTMNAVTTQVFVKRHHVTQVTNVESEVTKTGFSGWVGNKGGVSVRLDFYGVNLIFVSAHFQAHLENYADRIEDFNDIISSQKFRDDSVEYILDHDYVFWMGDLNFRIDDLDKAEIERRIENGDLKSLIPHDQLRKGMDDKLLFVDFEEGPLDFPPTYRFDKGTSVYDTSRKARKPAWTDRILWMVHEDSFNDVTLDAKLIKYSSLHHIKHSDHKPVYAEFEMTVLEKGLPMPVYFYHAQDTDRTNDFKFVYRLDADVNFSSWDWIGLYASNFSTYDDYHSWVYAPDAKIGEKIEAVMDSKQAHGNYLLAYFSTYKNCLVGYSNVFKLC